MARKLEVEFIGDTKSLEKAFGRAQTTSKKTGSSLSALRGPALAASAALGFGLAAAVKVGFGEMADSQKVAAQTSAVLKSTGGAAKVTSKHIEDLAGSISRKSGIDDEAIQTGQNMLLTFTGIRNEVGKGNKIFDMATVAATDMSVAMGTDAKTSALQLGKALNDPAAGMTKLQKVGVTFTDAQKKAAAAMVESGNKMGAQKIILGELNKEFGGSAVAAGTTLPGQLAKLKNSFEEVMGALAAKALPTINSVVTAVAKFVSQMQDGTGAGGKFRDMLVPAFEKVSAGAKGVFKAITDVVKGFQEGKTWAVALVGALAGFAAATAVIRTIVAVTNLWAKAQAALDIALNANPIGLVIVAVAALGAAMFVAYKKSETFRNIVDGAFRGIKAATRWLVEAGKDVAQWVGNAVGNFRRFASGVDHWIDSAVSTVRRFPGKIVGFFKDLPGKLASIGGDLLAGLGNGIKNGAGALLKTIKEFVTDRIPGFMKDALGIHSPSTVMMTIGGQITEGLRKGIEVGAGSMKAAVNAGLLFPIDAAIAALNDRKDQLQATWDAIDARAQRSALVAATHVKAVTQAATGGGGRGSGGGSGGSSGAGLEWAKSMVGHFKETGFNTGPELDKLQKEFGFHAAAWCAMFATKALVKAGGPQAVLTASVANLNQWAASGTHGLSKVSKPRAGDLMTFGNAHVGVVESVSGRTVHTIEGNTSAGAVSRGTRDIGSGSFIRASGVGGASASAAKANKSKADAKAKVTDAIKALHDFDLAAKRSQALAKIELKIKNLQQLQAFKDAIKGIGAQLKDIATSAAAAFRAQREKDIANGPLAQLLAQMKAEDQATQTAQERATLAKNLADAVAAGDVAAAKEAQDAINAYERQKTEEGIQAQIDAQLGGLDAEEANYKASLDSRLGALLNNLSLGKTSYAQFAKDVQATLDSLHLPPGIPGFETNAGTEATINAGPGPLGMVGGVSIGGVPLTRQGYESGALLAALLKGSKKGYATGTSSASSGLRWVGEHGPELMSFSGGEQVYSHGASMAMGGGAPTVQVFIDGQEFKGMIRTEIRETGRTSRGTYRAGNNT